MVFQLTGSVNLSSSHNLFGPLQAKNILVNVSGAKEVNFENYCVTFYTEYERCYISNHYSSNCVNFRLSNVECHIQMSKLFKYQASI